MRAWVVVLLIGGLATTAEAQPRGYLNVAGGGGKRWGETRSLYGYSYDSGGGIGMLRATAGAALSFDYDLELRIGVALDLYVGGLQDGAAGGPELEVNKELFERWRAGVRLFGGIGGGGQEAMVGLRLRNAPLVFGVDAVFARGGDGAEFTYSNGVIASVGVDGKGAKYILVIGAGAFVLLAVLAVVALGAGGGGH